MGGRLPIADGLRELDEESGTSRELESSQKGVALQDGEPEEQRRADDRSAGKEPAEPAAGRRVQEVLDLLYRNLDPVADPPKLLHGYDS